MDDDQLNARPPFHIFARCFKYVKTLQIAAINSHTAKYTAQLSTFHEYFRQRKNYTHAHAQPLEDISCKIFKIIKDNLIIRRKKMHRDKNNARNRIKSHWLFSLSHFFWSKNKICIKIVDNNHHHHNWINFQRLFFFA